MPDFKISLLKFSSTPIGTSSKGKLGIEDNKLSNSFLIKDCSLLIVIIFSEISLDFANNDLSCFFDISFFSCSKVSFS